MREDHRRTFLQVADHLMCWIGLREPNPLSDKYFALPNHVPKPLTCKAKTADHPDHQFAGLVVDPTCCPGAFKKSSLVRAHNSWLDFRKGGQLPPGYQCVISGQEQGIVLFHGSRIFSDYDLMTVHPSNKRGEWLDLAELAWKSANQCLPRLIVLCDDVIRELNKRLGKEMVQHPAEFLFTQGVGAKSLELILWFGPGQRMEIGISSMPKTRPH